MEVKKIDPKSLPVRVTRKSKYARIIKAVDKMKMNEALQVTLDEPAVINCGALGLRTKGLKHTYRFIRLTDDKMKWGIMKVKKEV